MSKISRGRHARPTDNRPPMNQRPPQNQRRQPPPPPPYGQHGRRKVGRRRGGCYVATACYGSYYAPQVLVLRRFRDEVMANSMLGRFFIKFYYTLSPFFAEKLKGYKKINSFIRTKILDKIVNRLKDNF